MPERATITFRRMLALLRAHPEISVTRDKKDFFMAERSRLPGEPLGFWFIPKPPGESELLVPTEVLKDIQRRLLVSDEDIQRYSEPGR